MTDTFKKRLSAKEPLIGTIVTLPTAEVGEILAELGFDWLWIDMEHAPFTVRDIQCLVQATECQCPCIVRAPAGEEVWIKKILDTGAAGVMIPHVSTPDQARRVLNWCKYPPNGTRSVGIARAQGYGLAFQDYVHTANQNGSVVLQIEDIEAVKNIESIVRVEGVDALMMGPYDLSGSMGKIGQVTDPDVQREIEKFRVACMEVGLPMGVFGIDAEAVKPYIDKGFTLVAAGVDTMYLIQGARETLKEIRQHLKS
jgi:2-keto-3-deoxy-L-rhamnonate aldolase RhmA